MCVNRPIISLLSPEFSCVDNGPAKVAPGFSPANAGPGRPKGLRHITNTNDLRI